MEVLTGIIILAAGNSSRLGKPKQLLQFKGNSLLRHTVIQAKLLENSLVVVVTGAYKEAIDSELTFTSSNVVFNEQWEEGMASSIRAGLNYILKVNPQVQACIFTVCDQPFISSQVFYNLLNEQKSSGRGIVASSYAGTIGTPVLFRHNYFNALLNLKGHEGAKKLLKLYTVDVAKISFEKGATDIDTATDYDNLINL